MLKHRVLLVLVYNVKLVHLHLMSKCLDHPCPAMCSWPFEGLHWSTSVVGEKHPSAGAPTFVGLLYAA